jgi:hypothetical protein
MYISFHSSTTLNQSKDIQGNTWVSVGALNYHQLGDRKVQHNNSFNPVCYSSSVSFRFRAWVPFRELGRLILSK